MRALSPPLRLLRPRGQTLVLFALTSLLMALLVLLTLGVGMRIRENHELQMLADAAAYSNAVATARTLNNVAMLNRLQVSHWVSMAADQGLISWSSTQRATLAAIRTGLEEIKAGAHGCTHPLADKYLGKFPHDLLGDMSEFEELDVAAGKEVRAIQGLISGLAGEQKVLAAKLKGTVQGGALTDAILSRARPGLPWPDEVQRHTSGGVEAINARELSGLGPQPGWGKTMRHATYGSRGHPWIISHGQMGNWLQKVVDASGGEFRVISQNYFGGAVWGSDMEDATGNDSKALFAHDHGQIGIAVEGCASGTHPVIAYVQSTDLQDVFDTDQHVYSPRTPEDSTSDAEHHTLGRCTTCPGVWVGSVALAPREVSDAHGQPKNYTVLHRNYAARGKGDPWNLLFDFEFDRSGDGVRFDNRGTAHDDTHLQAAMAAGMAYYHRKTPPQAGRALGFREFPNLLNPYWRATLVSVSVDATGKAGDVPNALGGAGSAWHSQVYQALQRAGFKGMH